MPASAVHAHGEIGDVKVACAIHYQLGTAPDQRRPSIFRLAVIVERFFNQPCFLSMRGLIIAHAPRPAAGVPLDAGRFNASRGDQPKSIVFAAAEQQHLSFVAMSGRGPSTSRRRPRRRQRTRQPPPRRKQSTAGAVCRRMPCLVSIRRPIAGMA